VVGQGLHARAVGIAQEIDHQPRLVQAEVGRRAADRLAHQRARAVAADDEAGVEVVDRGDGLAEPQPDVGEALQPVAQDFLQQRLVEVPVAGPAVRAGPLDAAPHHQGAAGGVDEGHALG